MFVCLFEFSMEQVVTSEYFSHQLVKFFNMSTLLFQESTDFTI